MQQVSSRYVKVCLPVPAEPGCEIRTLRPRRLRYLPILPFLDCSLVRSGWNYVKPQPENTERLNLESINQTSISTRSPINDLDAFAGGLDVCEQLEFLPSP